MNLQDLAKAYQEKTHEELLHLASFSEHLTPEAHTVLYGELSRRGIEVTEHLEAKVAEELTADSPRTKPSSLGISSFMGDLYRTYRSHFWLFVKLIAPAAVIGYLAVFMGLSEMRKIASEIYRETDPSSRALTFLEISLVSGSRYLVSWIASCFSFGAICVAVKQIDGGLTPSPGKSFKPVFEWFGRVLRLSVLLLVVTAVAETVAVLLAMGADWALNQAHVRLGGATRRGFVYGLALLTFLVVSRFALSIPVVVLQGCKVGESMFRSDELTEGKWGMLAILLAKSLLGGYLAAIAPYWLFSFIVGAEPVSWWFPWALSMASAAGVAIVEATMFIGFALLYVRSAWLPAASGEVPQ